MERPAQTCYNISNPSSSHAWVSSRCSMPKEVWEKRCSLSRWQEVGLVLTTDVLYWFQVFRSLQSVWSLQQMSWTGWRQVGLQSVWSWTEQMSWTGWRHSQMKKVLICLRAWTFHSIYHLFHHLFCHLLHYIVIYISIRHDYSIVSILRVSLISFKYWLHYYICSHLFIYFCILLYYIFLLWHP